MTPILARMLALSLALHLALAHLLGISPGSSVPYTWVVNARLAAAPRPRAEAAPAQPAEQAGPARAGPPVVQEANYAVAPVPAAEPIAARAPEPSAAPPAAPANAPTHAPTGPPPSNPAAAQEPLATLDAPVDATWYETRALDVPPKVVAGARPDYPEAARRAGLEGEVVLALRIDETGAVREARVLSAAPPGVFDAAALTAYGAARFTPARIQGRAVRAEVRLRALFRLDDE